ncbi:hypothetical protein ACH5RR_001314 [Cinchona calisaya]|uniref:SWIM-type domain-containing protein n=1 Tax=Cinchona calisaya TaxID=153742 RepID=A0ABD3B3U8_9GENT
MNQENADQGESKQELRKVHIKDLEIEAIEELRGPCDYQVNRLDRKGKTSKYIEQPKKKTDQGEEDADPKWLWEGYEGPKDEDIFAATNKLKHPNPNTEATVAAENSQNQVDTGIAAAQNSQNLTNPGTAEAQNGYNQADTGTKIVGNSHNQASTKGKGQLGRYAWLILVANKRIGLRGKSRTCYKIHRNSEEDEWGTLERMYWSLVAMKEGFLKGYGIYDKTSASLWSRSHFGSECKNEILVNNLNQAFNNYCLPARSSVVISMFEWIRRKLMQRIQIKRQGIERYEGIICQNIQERQEENKIYNRYCIKIYEGDETYEVDSGNTTHVVDFLARTCTCGLWKLTGIPCPYSIATIQKDETHTTEEYVEKCYSKEMYLQICSGKIRPIPSQEDLDYVGADPINPPLVRKQPRRPKKLRRRAAGELRDPTRASRRGLIIYCKRCFRPNPNLRGCKFPIHPKSKFYKESPTKDSTGRSQPAGNAEVGNEDAIATSAAKNTRNIGATTAGVVENAGNMHTATTGVAASVGRNNHPARNA